MGLLSQLLLGARFTSQEVHSNNKVSRYVLIGMQTQPIGWVQPKL